ncbi:MAG: VanZ family protein [Negativicutes bacterium]|nr:VanZ family protein [Negativicutes bacterium]
MRRKNDTGLSQAWDRKAICRLLSWFAVIAWMLLIFSFSQAPAPVSAAASLSVTERLLRFFGRTPTRQTLAYYESFVRSAAHFGLFFVLGCLIKLALTQSQAAHSLRRAILFSGGYALSDETHQLFVGGRAFQISDLLLDWSGCVLGACLILLLFWLFSKKEKIRAN